MKKTLAWLGCCLAALVVAWPASADNVDKAVAALKHASVYIDPDAPGVNADTVSSLQDLLIQGDNVALVMLPAGDLNGTDAATLASRIDAATGNKLIVGLVAGDQSAASSALLPKGIASDLMHSAANVSANPTDTLSSFVQYVHEWQSQHPKAPASKPVAKSTRKSGSGFPWWIIVIGVAAGAVAGIAFFIHNRPQRDPVSGEEYVRFRSPVRDELERIANLRPSIQDQDLRVLLTQICTDVEAYFRKFSSNQAADASTFAHHLETVRKVLQKYVEVQNDPPRYYDKPKEELLRSGYQAVDGFEKFVLDSIQRGSRAELTEFHVNTDILSAQRYS